jgi:hypothetical protein
MAVRGDGIIVVTTAGNLSGFSSLMLINSETGVTLPSPSIAPSSFKDVTGQVQWGYSRVGPPMVDSDGFIHLSTRFDYPLMVTSTAVWLMSIAKDGTTTTTQLTSTTEDVNRFPGRIIPDGRGGLIATWTVSPSSPPAVECPFRAAHVAGGSVVPYTLPITSGSCFAHRADGPSIRCSCWASRRSPSRRTIRRSSRSI